jgi:hypothetical protein
MNDYRIRTTNCESSISELQHSEILIEVSLHTTNKKSKAIPATDRGGSQMAVRLSALRTRRTLLPRNIIIFMFLVIISVTG